MLPAVRRIGHLIRLGFEWGGNAALLWQIGAPGVATAVLAGLLDLPLIWQIVVFVSAFLLLLAAVGEWRASKEIRPEAPPERVGIRNRGGGKSHSIRPTFGPDLDIAIDNSDGGDSTDEDATFH